LERTSRILIVEGYSGILLAMERFRLAQGFSGVSSWIFKILTAKHSLIGELLSDILLTLITTLP